MKCKNSYSLPLASGDIIRLDRTRSPAHVGKLRNAVDFACDEGTPILAAFDGEVVWLKQDSNVGGPDKKYWDDGNRIVIKHENDEYSAYNIFAIMVWR